MAWTQKKVEGLKADAKTRWLQENNLCIKVDPSGHIAYYCDLNRKKHHLGNHPLITLRQARKKKEALYNDHYMGKLESTKESFEEFVLGKAFLDWSKGTRKTHEARIASMQRTILPVIGKVKLSKLSKGDITRYKNARLAKGVTEATINRELNDISGVLTQAKEQGLIFHDVKIEKYREDKGKEIYVLEAHHVKALRKAARREGTPYERYQRKHIPVIIDIALFCGLRTGEILDLRWGDIVYRGYRLNELKEEADSEEEAIAFIEAERSDYAFSVKGQKIKTKQGTKTGQSRLVPIDAHIVETLLKYYSAFVAGANPDYRKKIVEHSKSGKPVERLGEMFEDNNLTAATMENVILPEDKDKRLFPFNKINEGINTAVEEAGLSKDVTLRTLRHRFCTYCLESGMTLQDVKVLAGHASITTTERYLHTNPKRKFQAYEKYATLIRKQIGI
jgi:integrase